MPEEDQVNRRLAAILAADVVGYSRMMGADETGTLSALKRHRETLFDPCVTQHKGRVVKLIGDGTLVEFNSVVDAVRCALAIQRAQQSEGEAASGRIMLRIGVNLGDIIIDGDDIYGDGVNVAARLEPLAEPGGVCVSAIVNESVGNRIDVTFRDGGDVQVKNIARPVRIWLWHPGQEPAPASAASTASAAPAKAREAERPSIAVLPFTNMSGDPEQEYFSDGISEDIITDLSKVGGLTVIARNSSFTYKGKSVDIRKVGQELGVTSVLEGSIRKAGNRVRITAQLIGAANGAHIWAERYDRDLTDIFAVQDEVTAAIVAALKVKLSPVEAERIGHLEAPTANVEAHDLFLRARELLRGRTWTRAEFDETIALLTQVIDLDPGYGEAYAALGMAYNLDFNNNWTGDPQKAQAESLKYAALGIEKAPNSAYAHFIASVAAIWNRDVVRAREEAEKALALSPNYAPAFGMRGLSEMYVGNPMAAVPVIEQAIVVDPAFKQQYLHFLGTAYLVAGKYETAAATFRERVRLAPQTDLSRGLLISALGHLGDTEEARKVWQELKQASPQYTLDGHLARLPFTDPAVNEMIREGVRKAGVEL